MRALAAIAVVALTATAHAQPAAPDLAQAVERFNRAVVLFDQGNYAAALVEFEKSHELSGKWELLFNIAVTQKRLYRYDASVLTFARYLAEGGERVTPERKKQVEDEEAETAKLTGVVTIAVDGGPASVEIDNLAGWTTPIDHAVLLASGEHTIVARRGAEIDTKKITIVSGQAGEVRLVPRAATKPITTGHLRVTTRPPGGAIADDATPLGPAPWEGDLEHGTHRIRATLAGRLPASEDVHLDPAEQRELVLDLRDLPEAPTPVYRRWYVLAAAGAVIVGGGAALYFATRSTPDVVIDFPR